MTVSFYEDATTTDRNASLTFYLGRYSMNGTFLGFQKLRSQMNLCPLNYADVLNMFKFGAVTESTCDFDLTRLLKLNPDELPKEANTFFELFILDRRGNLIDVPVLIKNFRNSKGETIN